MISFEPLFEYMRKNNISRYKLEKWGLNHSTFESFKNDKSISLTTLNQLCVMLNCQPHEIIKFIKSKDSSSEDNKKAITPLDDE